MANMKSLAKDTAIYGLSSIVGRFLNYLLVPLYTTQLSASSGGYGVITNMYAYTALILVLLTFGMETTFFRFANKEGEDPQKVYSTILTAVGFTALVFFANSSIVPIRQATAVLVNTICAPSSTTRSATFHAIDASFNAPKMIPRFPFNKLKDIVFFLILYNVYMHRLCFVLYDSSIQFVYT